MGSTPYVLLSSIVIGLCVFVPMRMVDTCISEKNYIVLSVIAIPCRWFVYITVAIVMRGRETRSLAKTFED